MERFLCYCCEMKLIDWMNSERCGGVRMNSERWRCLWMNKNPWCRGMDEQ